MTHRYIPNRLEREKTMFCEICNRAEDLLQGENMLRWHRLFLGRVRMTLAQQVFYKNDGNLFARLAIMRRIANDEIVRNTIENYPIGRNPIKLRIFHAFLKWKFCVGMYVLIALNR